MFNEDKICHHMHIQNIISMFEEKISKHFEEMVLLKGYLPIFPLLNFHIKLFIFV